MTDDESGKLDQLFSSASDPDSGQPIDPASTPASELKGKIAALLWEKRYEEALELLYAARWHTPDAAEISRGVKLLKERLVRRYVEELGDLDAVPSIAPGVNRATIEIADEERALLHLIDGISSFTDIAHQSRLGRFETYRALGRIVREGIVEVAPPPAPTPLSTPRRAVGPGSSGLPVAWSELEPTPAATPPQHRWRGLVVGAVSFAVTGAVGLTWWAITGSAPSLHPGAAVAGVPTPAPAVRTSPREGEPSASPPAGSRSSSRSTAPASPSAPGARQVALLDRDVKPSASGGSGAAAPSAIRRSSRAAAKSEERSKKRSASRATATVDASAAGRAHASDATASLARTSTTSTPGSLAASPADESDAPSLPELPERAPAAGRPAALAAPSHPATGGSPQVPQGLVKAAATSFAPASLSVATNDVTVRGPLGRSVVEQAVARAQADFRACYSARAAALRRNAAGTARVSLTIDEAGYATAVSAQGAPLPGLDGCLQEAASRIRTRLHPDVGLATVTFAVVFSIGGPAR